MHRYGRTIARAFSEDALDPIYSEWSASGAVNLPLSDLRAESPEVTIALSDESPVDPSATTGLLVIRDAVGVRIEDPEQIGLYAPDGMRYEPEQARWVFEGTPGLRLVVYANSFDIALERA